MDKRVTEKTKAKNKKSSPTATSNTSHTHAHSKGEHGHTHAHNEGEHGHTHAHSKGEHGHTHSKDFSKKASNRLSKAAGHLDKVKKMVEEEKDCVEVLTQLLAVKAALDSTGKYILKEHMSHCILDAAKKGDYQAIRELEKIIDSYLK